VHVSPECAAVLVAAGSAAGSVTSWAFAGPLLSSLGEGSFAAWWESALPIVSTDALFAKLQSIAMARVGSDIPMSSFIGDAATALRVVAFCSRIDSIEPESHEAKIISSLLLVQGKVGTAWDTLKSEETHQMWWSDINDVKDAFGDTLDKLKDRRERAYHQQKEKTEKSSWSDTWNEMKGKSFTDYFFPSKEPKKMSWSEAWNEIKDMPLADLLIPSNETKEMWRSDLNDIKNAFSNTWSKIKDRRSECEAGENPSEDD